MSVGGWLGLTIGIILLIGYFLPMWYVLRLHGARDRLRRGAVLVDVEKPGSIPYRHPGAALNIPLEELDRRAHEIGPPSTSIVVLAHDYKTGRRACNELIDLGFHDVFNAAGAGLKEHVSKTASDIADVRDSSTGIEADLESEEAMRHDTGR